MYFLHNIRSYYWLGLLSAIFSKLYAEAPIMANNYLLEACFIRKVKAKA